MKIAFIQNLPVMLDSYLVLSAALKKAGYETEVFVDAFESDLPAAVAASKPDLLGFNCLTGSYKWVLKTAAEIKKLSPAPVVIGGVHPTFYPETIDYSIVDYVCRGEGEQALVDLCARLSAGKPALDIPGIWAKTPDGLAKNDPRNLEQNMDSLPPNDWALYDKYPDFVNSHIISYRASRGCPYRCSFCFNSSLHKLYKGQKVYREFSLEHIFAELKEIKRRYKNLNMVFLSDESFGVNKAWSEGLLKRYAAEIGLPYVITARADFIDEAFADMLRDTGCAYINLSIETANEQLRKTVLDKDLSNEAVRKAVKLLRARGITVRITCIFCLPDETLADSLENVYFLKELGVEHPVGFLLQPFPLTPIHDYAVEKGQLQPLDDFNNLDPLVFFDTPMDVKDKDRIVNVQRLFFYGVRVPGFSRILPWLIKLPPNPLYELMQKISIAIIHKGFYKLSFLALAKYLWASRKLKA